MQIFRRLKSVGTNLLRGWGIAQLHGGSLSRSTERRRRGICITALYYQYLAREPSLAFKDLRFVFLVCWFFLLLQGPAEAQAKPIRRVLIFYEAGTSHPGINLIDQGIRTALENSPYKIEFYREYMETDLFPDPATQREFRNFYIHKYQNRQPDVIITAGPSPLKFMLE